MSGWWKNRASAFFAGPAGLERLTAGAGGDAADRKSAPWNEARALLDAAPGPAVLVVPGGRSFWARSALPALSPGKLKEALRHECETQIPAALEAVTGGFCPVGVGPGNWAVACTENKFFRELPEALRSGKPFAAAVPQELALVNGFAAQNADRRDFTLVAVDGDWSSAARVEDGKLQDLAVVPAGEKQGAEGAAALAARLRAMHPDADAPLYLCRATGAVDRALAESFYPRRLIAAEKTPLEYALIGAAAQGLGTTLVGFTPMRSAAQEFRMGATRLTAPLIYLALAALLFGTGQAVRAAKIEKARGGEHGKIEALARRVFGAQARIVDPARQLRAWLENAGAGMDGRAAAVLVRRVDAAVVSCGGGLAVKRLAAAGGEVKIEAEAADMGAADRLVAALGAAPGLKNARLERMNVPAGQKCLISAAAQIDMEGLNRE